MSIAFTPRSAIDAEAQMRIDDDGGPPVPRPLTGEPAPRDGEADPIAPRQCGRCRQLFEGDPTLHPAALPEWWLCPPCRLSLLGDPRGRPTTERDQTSVGRHRVH